VEYRAKDFIITRRRVLAGTAAVMAASVLAACGNPPAAATPTTAAKPTTAPPIAGSATSPPAASGSSAATAPAASASAGGTTPAAQGSAAASAPVKRGGTLFIGQDFGPQDMDPAKNTAWASTNVMELIYTGLLRWSPKMEIEPDLATSYQAVDDTTYVFKLRDGVTFHNGQKFSADDVKFTFDRIKDPATASVYLGTYAALKSVEVVDPLTVRFNLSQPSAAFLRYLATTPHGSIVPKGSGPEISKKPVGTGPFKFVDYALDQEVRLEKHAGYYEKDLPYLDKVSFKLLGDDTSISAAVRAKTVQITWLKDPKVAQNVANSAPGLQSSPGVSSRYLPILFDLTSPPFNDVRVRRAMSLAIDRKAVAKTVLGDFGAVGTFLPPSQFAGYTGDGSDLPYYKQDVAMAKSLLKEAGMDTLTVPEFKVVAANALDVQCAQVMKEQWAAAGINVTINPMEVGAILKDFSAGTYKMAVVGGVWAPDPDAEVGRFYSKTTSSKVPGINDPDLDALIEKGRITTDTQQRVAIYKQIQQRVLDQVYVIVPYVYPLRWELTWNFVKGYEVMPSNARLTVRKTWLDQ
jgi:peptide/nickel transport system substrate-binding protein